MSGFPESWRWIAHRGASAFAPENTELAFFEACRRGATHVELDVQISADGVAFVFHDANTDRLCGGVAQRFCSLSSQQIEVLRVGTHAVPRLEVVLALCQSFGATVYTEVKSKAPAAAALILTAAKKTRCAIVGSSFHLPHLQVFKDLSPRTPRQGLFSSRWGAPWAACPAGLLSEVGISLAGATLRRVRDCQARGLPVSVYTVNELSQAQSLAAWGVSGVFTDHVRLGG